MKYRSKLFFSILLAGLLLCAVSCKKDTPPTPIETLPDSIETVVKDPVTEPDPDTAPAPDAVTTPADDKEETEPETKPGEEALCTARPLLHQEAGFHQCLSHP